jgi:hypothetical protein
MADTKIGGYCIFPVTLFVFPDTRGKATGQVLIYPDLNHDAAESIANDGVRIWRSWRSSVHS